MNKRKRVAAYKHRVRARKLDLKRKAGEKGKKGA